MQMLGQAAGEFSVTLVSNESPTNFELRLDATNLPQFEAILQTVAKMHQSRPVASSAWPSSDAVKEPAVEARKRVDE